MPKITIDYTSAVQQRGGIGRFTRELIHGLARLDRHSQFRLFVAGSSRASLGQPPGANFVWRSTKIPPNHLTRIWHRARLPLPVEIFSGRADVFHAPDFSIPPTLSGTRRLVMVHDLSFEKVSETFTPWLLRYLRQVVPRSIHSADLIIANSIATRNDYLEHFGLSESQFTVIHGGVSPCFHPIAAESDRVPYPGLARPYVFAVGTLQPRKNFARLIGAMANLRARGCELDLVIAGGRGWLADEIFAIRARLGLQDRVHLLGYVRDDKLPDLYRHARIFAYPSLYEGFGLPLLEAMACGVPVMTSSGSSLPETAGDAAWFIDPYDVASMADGLYRLHDDERLRSEFITKGLARARQFTWEQAAGKLIAVYDRLLH